MEQEQIELDETLDIDLTDIHTAIEELKNVGKEHQQINEYDFENNTYTPNYEGIYNSTIHNTGTALDDRDIDEVAQNKKATPKQIWDTMDVLSSIADGVRAGLANTYEFGGELLTTATDPYYRAYKNVTGKEGHKEPTEEEKQSLNPFGSTETSESKSYAGSILGGAAQLGTGIAMTPGGAVTKGAKYLGYTAKTAKGVKTLKLFDGVVNGLAAENISFDDNMTNLTEFVSETFDMTPPEMLAKGENDEYFTKKLKNTMDSALAGFIVGSTFKMVKTFFPKETVKKAAEAIAESKIVKTTLKPVEKASETVMRKVDPIGSIAREQEKISEIAQKEIAETGKEFAEAVVQHPRNLTSKEVDDVIKQAQKRGTVSKDLVKNASKTVLRDVANGIIELERSTIKAAKKANELDKELLAGKITQEQYEKQVLENFTTTIKDAAVKQKTASSIAGTAEQIASKSDSVKDVNRLIAYLMENQDKVPVDKLNEFMMNMDNSKVLNSLLDTVTAQVRKGKNPDMVDKFTQVMQNVMLTSVSSRLQDAVGSMANYSLQVLDAGTAGVIGSAKHNIRNVAAKVGLATVKDETDRVFLNEAYNILHGTYSLAKETLVYGAKKLDAKIRNKEFTDINPYKKARAQAVSSMQSRLGKKYSSFKLIKSDNPIARMLNYSFNHMGIWAAEQFDDLIGAFAYRGHLERNVAHDAMVKGIKNNWTREQIKDYTRKQLTEHIDYSFDPQNVLKLSELVTPEGRMMSRILRSAGQAEDTTFRSEIKSPLGKWIYSAANADAVRKFTRIIFPFQKVGIKLAIDDYVSTRNPLTTSLRPGFWKEVMAGGARQDEAIGKLVNGLLIQGVFWYLYKQGKITGPTPANKNKAAMLKSIGWQPFSMLNDDGEYVPLKNFMGPYEQMMKSVTTLISSLDEINERVDDRVGAEFTDHILKLPTIIAESSVASSFIGDLIDNIDRGDTLGVQKFARTMATFGVPLVDEFRELFNEEEFKQTTLTPLDAFASKYGFGETVDELDLFGEPLWATKRKYYVGPKATERIDDPVIEEMLHYKAYVQPPNNFVTKDKASVKLTKEEVYEWQKYMADPEINSYNKMLMLIKSYEYQRSPEAENNPYGLETKREQLVSKYNELKEKAFDKLFRNNMDVRNKFAEANENLKYPNIDETFKKYVPTLEIK